MLDVGRLRFLRAQELAPRRQVEEKLPHLDGRARRAAGRFDLQDLAAVDDDSACPSGRTACSRSRVVRVKRLTLAMLGRASPRKPMVAMAARSSARRILLVAWRSRQSSASSRLMPKPSSVTRTRLRPPAWISTVTRVACGIQRVLDQFLHHAGRPLNHFAGGDLIGHLLGQQADAVHDTGRAMLDAGYWILAGSRDGKVLLPFGCRFGIRIPIHGPRLVPAKRPDAKSERLRPVLNLVHLTEVVVSLISRTSHPASSIKHPAHFGNGSAKQKIAPRPGWFCAQIRP